MNWPISTPVPRQRVRSISLLGPDPNLGVVRYRSRPQRYAHSPADFSERYGNTRCIKREHSVAKNGRNQIGTWALCCFNCAFIIVDTFRQARNDGAHFVDVQNCIAGGDLLNLRSQPDQGG